MKSEYYNVQRMDWFCSIGLYDSLYLNSTHKLLYLNSSQKVYYLVIVLYIVMTAFSFMTSDYLHTQKGRSVGVGWRFRCKL